jgi:hypothetical protein
MDLDFNFNEWAFLAQTNPEGFERYREQYLVQFLRTTGKHRSRLEALQASIDVERELAESPEEALLYISQRMCTSLSRLGDEVQELKALLPHAMMATANPSPLQRYRHIPK